MEARGATAVLAGGLTAVGLVFVRGGTFADLGFRRPKRWATVPFQVAGNLGAAISMALILPLTASIPEEIIYRGFLIGRLSDIFGRNFGGAFMAVLVQALVFGAIHFQWGIGGMVVTVIMGVVWGTAYLLCDRNLWVVILAHSA